MADEPQPSPGQRLLAQSIVIARQLRLYELADDLHHVADELHLGLRKLDRVAEAANAARRQGARVIEIDEVMRLIGRI